MSMIDPEPFIPPSHEEAINDFAEGKPASKLAHVVLIVIIPIALLAMLVAFTHFHVIAVRGPAEHALLGLLVLAILIGAGVAWNAVSDWSRARKDNSFIDEGAKRPPK